MWRGFREWAVGFVRDSAVSALLGSAVVTGALAVIWRVAQPWLGPLAIALGVTGLALHHRHRDRDASLWPKLPRRLLGRGPIEFGAPEQRAGRPHFSWWFVTVTTSRKLDDCRIFIQHDHHRQPTVWQLRHSPPLGEFPPEVVTLTPGEPNASPQVAVAVRAEGRYPDFNLPGHVARLCTRPFYGIEMVLPEAFVEPETGVHELRLCVASSSGEWVSPPYWLRVPEYWEGNATFTLTVEKPEIPSITLTADERTRFCRAQSARELAEWLPFARRLAAEVPRTDRVRWHGGAAERLRKEAEALTNAIVPCVRAFSPATAAAFRLTQLRDGADSIVLVQAGVPPTEQRSLSLYAAETARLLEDTVRDLDESASPRTKAQSWVDVEALGDFERLVGHVHQSRIVLSDRDAPVFPIDTPAFNQAARNLSEAINESESRVDRETATILRRYVGLAEELSSAAFDLSLLHDSHQEEREPAAVAVLNAIAKLTAMREVITERFRELRRSRT